MTTLNDARDRPAMPVTASKSRFVTAATSSNDVGGFGEAQRARRPGRPQNHEGHLVVPHQIGDEANVAAQAVELSDKT
ncbi:hypothetical protein NLM27_27010 [Bradyrhizobium sp. CCGB12]|uniref:hypothetical protein n=1 Tax=Bradyrhizobium sp. CCGB12 TaxID=2949632 RepID=UPI0020B1F507|nr:hypothetical protein [Bradyrhizobium sp. CCGB12]MCP3392400.1 hypothetical protein [Bradyrhizobium sp. CCGB12]